MKNPVTAALLRFLNPGYSYCAECGYPWNHCKSKSIPVCSTPGVLNTLSIFAVCEECFHKLPLDKLKIHYTELYRKWPRGAGCTLGGLLKNLTEEKIKL